MGRFRKAAWVLAGGGGADLASDNTNVLLSSTRMEALGLAAGMSYNIPASNPSHTDAVKMSLKVIKIGIIAVGRSGYSGFVEKRPRGFTGNKNNNSNWNCTNQT
jgi:hypothetical protein